MQQQTLSFGETLEAIEQLSCEEQEELLDIVRKRIAERNRARLIAEIHEADREFAAGECSVATPEEIMKEILG